MELGKRGPPSSRPRDSQHTRSCVWKTASGKVEGNRTSAHARNSTLANHTLCIREGRSWLLFGPSFSPYFVDKPIFQGLVGVHVELLLK